jgi:restriction system protein
MPRKSILEDIAENSLKHPGLGFFTSVIFLCIGIYLSFSHGSDGSAGTVFSGFNKMFAYFCYGLSAFAAVFAAIGYIKNKVGKKERLEFFESKKTLLSLKQLSWKEFEHFVGTFFEKQDYTVEVTGGLRDGGIDLIVKKNGRVSYVQCKKYRENQVTLSMMRDFYGAISSQAITNPSFFVTTGTFTLDARKFAEENAIEAIDGSRLMEYLKTVDVQVASGMAGSAGSAAPAFNQKSKRCPDCGAPMVVRVAKKGTHANEPFWGCSTFPKCKAIVAYADKV